MRPATDQNPYNQRRAIIRHRFADIDDFTRAMAGWDLDFRQLRGADSRVDAEGIAGSVAVIRRLRFAPPLHQQGTTSPDELTFGFPEARGVRNWSGTTISGDVMLDFNDPAGFDMGSAAGMRGIVVTFPRDAVERCIRDAGLAFASRIRVGQPPLSLDQAPLVRAYRDSLFHYFERASRDRFGLPMPEPDLLLGLLVALDLCHGEQVREPLHVRHAALRRTVAFIEQHGHECPNMQQVCAGAGVSWRTLDRAFKETFGIGPKRYLLNRRLQHVRRALNSRADHRMRAGQAAVPIGRGLGFVSESSLWRHCLAPMAFRILSSEI